MPIMTTPQAIMMVGNHIEGLHAFITIFEGTSNMTYEAKKMAKHPAYCISLNRRCSERPNRLALPMLVRSRKERR